MSHDTQKMAGDFQMIDLLVDMAQKHRWAVLFVAVFSRFLCV